MEKGEVFDSTLLKNMINSLIAESKRNFAIDLNPLDYIYSDAINVILALNRRILDVSGRLSLMGPSPEVRQILERTGIQNILKIFDTETELLKSSEDIILQTTRYNLTDLQNYQQSAPPPPKPKSEFEDFRSEISRAMSPVGGAVEPEPDISYHQPQQHLETEVTPDNFGPPPPVKPPPATKRIQQGEEFTVQPEPAGKEKRGREYHGFSRYAGDMKPKKDSSMPIIITVVVVALLAVGVYFAYTIFMKPQQSESVASGPVVSQPVPEQPVTPPSPAPEIAAPAQPATEEPVASETKPASEKAAPVHVAEQPVKKAASAKPAHRKAPVAEPARKPAPAPAAESAPAAQTGGKITITSSPSGATIKADDNVIGTTPYVWKNPNIMGEVTLSITKPGYKEAAKVVEYTGGISTESFSLELEKQEPAPMAKPAPQAAPEPENIAPPPKPVPAPATREPEPAQAASPAEESATVFIASIPPVADVYMDGKLIGKTNISKLNVQAGSHNMRFVKGTQEVTKDMTFKAGDNPSQLVNFK
jgi:anti-anti-sigma factor